MHRRKHGLLLIALGDQSARTLRKMWASGLGGGGIGWCEFKSAHQGLSDGMRRRVEHFFPTAQLYNSPGVQDGYTVCQRSSHLRVARRYDEGAPLDLFGSEKRSK
jgi:hypothetical protein